jgi:hypothetical protein
MAHQIHAHRMSCPPRRIPPSEQETQDPQAPLTQSVGYHIHFSGEVADSKIVILDKLQQSSLSKVKLWLREDIFQTLMIVPPNLESLNHND